jgi:hypothetical protein
MEISLKFDFNYQGCDKFSKPKILNNTLQQKVSLYAK